MKCYIHLILIIFIFAGCTKFVQVPPPNTEIVSATVYNSDATSAAAVTGIFETMIGNSIGGGLYGISELAGLSADEISLYPNNSTVLNEVYVNAQQSNNSPGIWSDLYNCLYQANNAILELNSSTGVSPAMEAQLTGECKFIRAFCLFYLTEIYGDIPLATGPAYQINDGLSRASQVQVFQQIILDLSSAQTLLRDTYNAADGTLTSDRIRPNKSAATALLARAYLYSKNWDSAAIEASAVINDGQYALNDLDTVFLSISTEAIWELQPLDNSYDTPDGDIFLDPIIYSTGPSIDYPLYLNNNLIGSFEPNDLRRSEWIDSVIASGVKYYIPYKYKIFQSTYPPLENVVILRLAEQYLIRSEAQVYGTMGGINGALEDLNVIRNRAGLPNYSGPLDQTSVLNAILHERRVELFTEYGHRWLDLQRTNTIDSVMVPVCVQKGGTWNHDWELFPIPLSEMQVDSKLTQNSGY